MMHAKLSRLHDHHITQLATTSLPAARIGTAGEPEIVFRFREPHIPHMRANHLCLLARGPWICHGWRGLYTKGRQPQASAPITLRSVPLPTLTSWCAGRTSVSLHIVIGLDKQASCHKSPFLWFDADVSLHGFHVKRATARQVSKRVASNPNPRPSRRQLVSHLIITVSAPLLFLSRTLSICVSRSAISSRSPPFSSHHHDPCSLQASSAPPSIPGSHSKSWMLFRETQSEIRSFDWLVLRRSRR